MLFLPLSNFACKEKLGDLHIKEYSHAYPIYLGGLSLSKLKLTITFPCIFLEILDSRELTIGGMSI